jgi:hypothetical protein
MTVAEMIVDRRCSLCQSEGKTDIYRMIGGCYNCRSEPILGLFSATHESSGGKCPVCACGRLHWDRLATADEIPQAFGSAASSETPLSDALHTIGEVTMMAQSMTMSGEETERGCGRRILAALGRRAESCAALPVAADPGQPQLPGQLPLPETEPGRD